MKTLARQKVDPTHLKKLRKLKRGDIVYKFTEEHINEYGFKWLPSISVYVVIKINKASMSVCTQESVQFQIKSYHETDYSYKEMLRYIGSYTYIDFENVFTSSTKALKKLQKSLHIAATTHHDKLMNIFVTTGASIFDFKKLVCIRKNKKMECKKSLLN